MILRKIKPVAFERGMRPEGRAFAGEHFKTLYSEQKFVLQITVFSISASTHTANSRDLSPSDGQLYYVLHFWEG